MWHRVRKHTKLIEPSVRLVDSFHVCLRRYVCVCVRWLVLGLEKGERARERTRGEQ